MDTTRFIRNFVLFKEALQKQNFNNKDLNTTSMQAALQSEQLALNEEVQGLQSEQVRAKMQIDFLAMQANLQNTKAETLNKLIQCQAMLKSLKDNAMINRANALVSLLQVAANGITASNFETAFKIIAQIGSEYNQITFNNIGNGSVSVQEKEQTNELKTILNNLSRELEKLNEQSEVNSIQVFSDKLEVLKDAPIRLWGFSTLSNADEGFYNENNEQIASGSVCLFRSDKVGKHTVTFKASNTKTSLAKNITISVIANKLKERIN
ncbi:hypothetical protein [Helicobacter pylori]|uniref:hypothetical protein n=1 Tax=Helicobacter pylori TaxID=210 RepID=UPI000C2FF67F|nr:hypothetical protein [Helicobacter pylori]